MKNKLKLVIWPLIYLVLIINVCISFVLVFRSYYFTSIFVSGSSMLPTLVGGEVGTDKPADYGIIDAHNSAIENIKRFQIVTTYYPFSDSKDYVNGYTYGEKNVIDEREASYKIKRVYAFPYETVKFVVDQEMLAATQELLRNRKPHNPCDDEIVQYYASRSLKVLIKGKNASDFKEQKLKFKRRIEVGKIPNYDQYEYTLGENEYWVMGDNYASSTDCYSHRKPIYKDNIVGVLVAIEGRCYIDFSNDSSATVDGTKITYKCKQRKRHLPKYY